MSFDFFQSIAAGGATTTPLESVIIVHVDGAGRLVSPASADPTASKARKIKVLFFMVRFLLVRG
jgi:hypothetical protein